MQQSAETAGLQTIFSSYFYYFLLRIPCLLSLSLPTGLQAAKPRVLYLELQPDATGIFARLPVGSFPSEAVSMQDAMPVSVLFGSLFHEQHAPRDQQLPDIVQAEVRHAQAEF